MPTETITITNPDDTLIYDVARQQSMQEGADIGKATEHLRSAVASGQDVTILQEMNTRAILELTVNGERVISKISSVA